MYASSVLSVKVAQNLWLGASPKTVACVNLPLWDYESNGVLRLAGGFFCEKKIPFRQNDGRKKELSAASRYHYYPSAGSSEISWLLRCRPAKSQALRTAARSGIAYGKMGNLQSTGSKSCSVQSAESLFS